VILLAIDTSTRYAGVAVLADGRTHVERVWRSEQNHGRELMPACIEALSGAGVTPPDITHIAVALGPGGFSAVRVGISAAIGLALPRALPVAGVPTHEVEAALFLTGVSAEEPLYSLIPAGRSDIAWARFESAGAPVESGLASPAVMAAMAPAAARYCGEGAVEMVVHVGTERILSGPPPTRSPLQLALLARRRFEAGLVTPGAGLQAIYGRAPSITAPRPVP
jgi:tRNA threonylcarbamoyladenosine biosynthesis protein TsaB